MRQSSQLSDSTDAYNGDSNRLAIHLATILQNHPELASVVESLVESWPKLPEPVRASIGVMISALVGTNVKGKSG